MLAKNNRPDPRLEALKYISRCPVCNEKYDSNHAEVFDEREAANLVHITCHKCQSNFIAMTVSMAHGSSSVGVVTDLNFKDAKKFYQASPITVDEVIAGYQFLKK